MTELRNCFERKIWLSNQDTRGWEKANKNSRGMRRTWNPLGNGWRSVHPASHCILCSALSGQGFPVSCAACTVIFFFFIPSLFTIILCSCGTFQKLLVDLRRDLTNFGQPCIASLCPVSLYSSARSSLSRGERQFVHMNLASRASPAWQNHSIDVTLDALYELYMHEWAQQMNEQTNEPIK